MTQLSVNVNKLATLRNSRGKNTPDVAEMAKRILEWGAQGITVHPRPDGRHIRLDDVRVLNRLVQDWNRERDTKIEFNIEGYPSPDYIELIREIQPDQATLVPDPPEALTSNAGWDLLAQEAILTSILKELRQETKARVSVFVDPAAFDENQTAALSRLRPHRIELYTERFSDHFHSPERDQVVEDYRRVSEIARDLGIGVNAGHDLNQDNLGYLIQRIPWIDEVSIGHAIVCEALIDGFEKTVKNYLRILKT
jgi:pyridoxine 5-phosphate synthase